MNSVRKNGASTRPPLTENEATAAAGAAFIGAALLGISILCYYSESILGSGFVQVLVYGLLQGIGLGLVGGAMALSVILPIHYACTRE